MLELASVCEEVRTTFHQKKECFVSMSFSSTIETTRTFLAFSRSGRASDIARAAARLKFKADRPFATARKVDNIPSNVSKIDHDVRSRRRKLVLSPHCLWLPFGEADKRGQGADRRRPARHQGPRHLGLRDASVGRTTVGGAAQRARGLGAQRDWSDSSAGPHPIRSRPAKTRSGKIMRRILRKIAEDEFGSLGDS